MSEVDELFDDLLTSNKQDSSHLVEYIKKAREEETKAKVQIYTMKGKKSLEKLQKEYEEEEEEEVNYMESEKFDDIRKQIEHYRELERIELENIERLKKERELQQVFYDIDKKEILSQRSIDVEEIQVVSFNSVPSVEIQQQAPPQVKLETPVPSLNSTPSSDSLLSPRSRRNKAPEAPSGYMANVISVQWDGAPKSKKNNKVYTISFSASGKSWKVVRTDENLVEFSKRMLKSKAEGTPVPPLTKKSIKKDQQQELSTQLEEYLNGINLAVVFKREKPRQIFLKFIAPVGQKDDGYGSVKGNEFEAWYVSSILNQ